MMCGLITPLFIGVIFERDQSFCHLGEFLKWRTDLFRFFMSVYDFVFSDFSVTSLKMAVILTLSVMAAWTVQTTLLSAPPLTLTSPKWTPVMTGLAQVRRPHCFLWGSVEYSERVSKYATIFFSGGQSDQGYDSLSKEEERFCSRETDGTALAEEKMLRRAGES